MTLSRHPDGTPKTPRTGCPVCLQALDAASDRQRNTPRPGDVSVCMYCATALEFGADMRPVLLTQATSDGLSQDTLDQLEQYRRAILTFRTKK